MICIPGPFFWSWTVPGSGGATVLGLVGYSDGTSDNHYVIGGE